MTQKVTLEELGQKYKEMSVQIFNQSRLNGTTNLVLNHSYYDTALWEKIIKEHLGEITLTSTNRNPKCPKVSWENVKNWNKISLYKWKQHRPQIRSFTIITEHISYKLLSKINSNVTLSITNICSNLFPRSGKQYLHVSLSFRCSCVQLRGMISSRNLYLPVE